MALLLSDGFSLYTTAAAALKIKNWTVVGSSPGFAAAGRWGTGSYAFSPNSLSTYATQTFTVSGSTTIVSMGVSLSSSNSGTITSITVNGVVIALESVSSSSSYFLRIRNQTTSTTIFTSPTTYTTVSFFYIEFKVIWGTSGTGRIVLRVDNTQIYDSGATLTLAAANGSAIITLGGSTASVFGTFTDLLIMDGSGASFNDFQGDVRIETLRPSADGAYSAWALPNNTLLTDVNQARITTSTGGWAGLTGTTTLTRTATGGPDLTKFVSYLNVAVTSGSAPSIISSPNGTSGYAVTPGQTLGVSLWTYCVSSSPSVGLAARFYDSGGSQVGSDLSFGSVTADITTWGFKTAPSTVTVPASAATCALILTPPNSSLTFRFTGFVLSSNSATPAYVDPGNPHYIQSNDFSFDSEISYIRSDVLNAKESYTMTDMSANGAILGVRPIIVARKETSGPQRTIATTLRIGSTDYVNANNQIVPSSLAYTTFSDFYPTSPATGTAWTKSEVNGMETGFSITQ